MDAQFGPQGPRWYPSPQGVSVPLEEVVNGPYPEEIGVRIKINGYTKSAVVPREAVDESKMIVRGAIIGETDNGILIVLPPSSMGRTILEMKQEIIDAFVGLQGK